MAHPLLLSAHGGFYPLMAEKKRRIVWSKFSSALPWKFWQSGIPHQFCLTSVSVLWLSSLCRFGGGMLRQWRDAPIRRTHAARCSYRKIGTGSSKL